MPATTAAPASSFAAAGALRLIFYVLAIVLALVHVFVTFRGISSTAGMDQAQLAREIARGNGLHTKVIRPFAWAQMLEAGKEVTPGAMPELWQLPLPATLLAPTFRLLEGWSTYTPEQGSTVFLLDRVVAGYGVIYFLLSIVFIQGAARRLFDERVAGVTALCLVVCQPLWGLATSGSPLILLMAEFSLAFRVLVSAIRRAQAGQSTTVPALLIGVLGAAMALTHWMALWLILGLAVAIVVVMPGRRGSATLLLAGSAVALAAWCWRNYSLCGDPLGAAKTFFQAMIFAGHEDMLQRDYSIAVQAVDVQGVLKELGNNWVDLLDHLPAMLGSLAITLLAPIAFLHRFRRRDGSACRWVLFSVTVAALLGMGLEGIQEDFLDDHNLLAVLAPLLCAFGVAMLAMLWARFDSTLGGFWNRSGYLLLAISISAMPMLARLPTALSLGLERRNQLAHWPPYIPERVSFLSLLLDENEIIAADAPWFSAWYGDIPSIWIPAQRIDFEAMRKAAAEAGNPVAGFLVTPVSAQVPKYLGQVFEGDWREWPDLVFRGPLLGFDRDFMPWEDFPYKVPVPLVPFTVNGADSQSMLMVFYTDRQRSFRQRPKATP